MHIGILTFHASFNYGSMLQAWAMQRWLANEGHTSAFIDFRPSRQAVMYANPLHVHSVRQGARLLYNTAKYGRGYLSKNRRWKRYNAFLDNMLAKTVRCDDIDKIREVSSQFDAIIFGSDQIWNTCAVDFSEAFLGTTVPDSVPRIAYAPSFGPFPDRIDTDIFRGTLQKFRAISVREQRTADFIRAKGLYDNDMSVVVDPTFLIPRSDYETIADKGISPVDGEYMYYYTPSGNTAFIDAARNEATRLNLPLVIDTGYSTIRRRYKDAIYVDNAGPLEFINLIRNARYVVASSFHAIVFSIIFNKEFTALNGDSDSRKSNILQALGLTSRSYSMTDNSIRPSERMIDYKGVSGKLHDLIDDAEKYLKKNLY